MQIFSPSLSTSPFSSPLLPFSSSPHIYDWYVKKFCHRKCCLCLTFLKKNTHFFSEPFRKCISILLELVIAENPELPHKTSHVTHLFLSNLRVANEFHSIDVLHRTSAVVVDTFTGIFYDSLSQVEFNIISVIIILQRFMPGYTPWTKSFTKFSRPWGHAYTWVEAWILGGSHHLGVWSRTFLMLSS